MKPEAHCKQRCVALWWSHVRPAGIFHFGNVDVAVTSMPEMTRIVTLTPGLVSFHQKYRRLSKYELI